MIRRPVLPPCANVSLSCSSQQRAAPPYGRRFAYDSGGRTLSVQRDTDVGSCALLCAADGAACRGYTWLPEERTCYTPGSRMWGQTRFPAPAKSTSAYFLL